MWEVNARRDPRWVEAHPLPRAAPATHAAMVRRARRRENEMLAGCEDRRGEDWAGGDVTKGLLSSSVQEVKQAEGVVVSLAKC